jgi:ABC-type transporter Mla subunit MlaD
VAESSLREKVTAQLNQIKTVANQIVATEQALKALPIAAQQSAHSLAYKLRSISEHLAHAADFGAATAHRLSGIAHAKVQEIDDAAPLNAESMESLKGVAVLTRMANDAAATGINLLNANKEAVKSLDEPAVKPPSLNDWYSSFANA